MIQPRYAVSGGGHRLFAAFCTFSIICTIAIALRVYVRMRVVKSFGIDDWMVLLGWVLFVCLSACAMAGTHFGLGQHLAQIEPKSQIPIGLRVRHLCPMLLSLF